MAESKQGNDWLKYWTENQKKLFQSWTEGKLHEQFTAPGAAAGNGKAAGQQANDWLKAWAEGQKKFFDGWAEGKFAQPFGDSNSGLGPGGDPAAEMLKRTMQEWASFTKEAWSGKGRFDPEAIKRFLDPAEWKRAGTQFDGGLEKLVEGPTYATLWDLDRKILGAHKLWLDRARDIESYYGVVAKAWGKAYERYTKSLGDDKAPPLESGRAMLDLWLETSNSALVEMHRSQEFLEAQRRMTRSSTEYLLAERQIAESFCELHHIPTRTEMDEVQKSLAEMRRELRAAARQQGAAPAAPKKRATKSKRRR